MANSAQLSLVEKTICTIAFLWYDIEDKGYLFSCEKERNMPIHGAV